MSKQRTPSLDNLRTCLTAPVIAHHAAIPYSSLGTWPYTSLYHSPGSSGAIIAFNTVNQSFFVGCFFLLSGYFSAKSARQKTRRGFMGEQWKRLGVPTVVYSVINQCVIDAVLVAHQGGSWGEVLKSICGGVKSARGVRGPMWYCVLVLVFDVMYALAWPSDFAEQ